MFKSQNRLLEANRIQQRVEYDLEMLQETGYINGIENYSIYFEQNRKTGDPPYTLVDYFKHRWGNEFLTVIDESHVTIPQIKGMYFGDVARKKTLVDFGFRLPSAFDNRPLKFEEFNQRTSKIIYVSATPSPFEIEQSQNHVVEQIIRPTGLIDPHIEIRTSNGQIPDILEELKKQIQNKQRTLLITLTKRMSEDLSTYLSDINNTQIPIKVAYLHSDIDTLERTEILDKLRSGDYDVLVGVNLLREGLDLPEVSLVAILDAGQQGFLRSRASLIQIMGRASRHLEGKVILYSDFISPAMKEAVNEVKRRRKIQLAYNKANNITPQSITKSIRPKIIELVKTEKEDITQINPNSLTPPQRQKHITALRKQMKLFASELNFEEAINKFNLKWPYLIGKWPSEEFDEKVSESENRLLIKCGNKNYPRFWKYLCDENLLYTGGELPPIQYLSLRCIVIPDSACVSVIIKHKDFFNNYPLDYFGPVGRYNSNTVPFQI